MLTMLGWLAFSLVYFLGAMAFAALFFGSQGSFWIVAILIAAVLLWGYFTAYLISAFRQRNATAETNAS